MEDTRSLMRENARLIRENNQLYTEKLMLLRYREDNRRCNLEALTRLDKKTDEYTRSWRRGAFCGMLATLTICAAVVAVIMA